MTVTTTAARFKYAGDGVSVSFPVPCYFFADDDLKVYVISEDGTPSLKALTTHYTVADAGSANGGTVTFLTAPAADESVVILRDPTDKQEVDYENNDSFPASSHENALDRRTMVSQRLSERLGRALRLHDADPVDSDDLELPTAVNRRGKYLYFDDTDDAPPVPAASIEGTTITQSVIAGLLYPQTAAEAAAGVTPQAYHYEPGHILRYIATTEHAAILAGTSTYDASTAAQDWLDALEAGAIATLIGTVRAQGLRLKTNNVVFEGGGWLKPVTDTSAVILTIGDDSDDTQVRRIRGNLRIGSESESFASWSNVTGLKLERVTECDLGLDVVGLGVGVLCAPAEGACAYNTIRLGLIGQNKVGVRLAPTGSGFVNENLFIGGRLRTNTGSYVSGVVSVDIQNSGSNQPNNNVFYKPVFEGPGKAIKNNGSRIRFLEARWEGSYTGTPDTDYPAEIIEIGSDEKECVYDFSYNSDVFDGGYVVDHGAGTRVDDYTFTIAGVDVTPWFYPGAMIDVTVSGTTHRVVCHKSSFSTNTTVRVARGVITANPTACETPRITVDAPNVPRRWHFSDMDIVGTTDASHSVVNRHRETRIASPQVLAGLNDTYPSITFAPGTSASDRCISVQDFTAQTAYLTHQGRLWVSRFAMGDQTTPAASQAFVADPTGGATVDTENRAVTASILDILIAIGAMKSS